METGRSDWSLLASSVEAGELYLEPGVANKCARRCADLISELGAIRDRAYLLKDVDGVGTLPSGRVLTAKFGKKAVGGDYSLVQALTDHIEEVGRMRAVFESIDARFSATEDENASRLGRIEHE